MLDAEPPLPPDDEPSEAANQSPGYQFGLRALFSLVSAAAVYFFLERITHGRFALISALGALAVGLTVPVLFVLAWLAKSFVDGKEPWATILFVVGVAAAIVACLALIPGF